MGEVERALQRLSGDGESAAEGRIAAGRPCVQRDRAQEVSRSFAAKEESTPRAVNTGSASGEKKGIGAAAQTEVADAHGARSFSISEARGGAQTRKGSKGNGEESNTALGCGGELGV